MERTYVIKNRIGYDNHYCLIVPDHAAGMRNRFTVYRIPSCPGKRIRIIGRELPLGFARKIAAKG